MVDRSAFPAKQRFLRAQTFAHGGAKISAWSARTLLLSIICQTPWPGNSRATVSAPANSRSLSDVDQQNLSARHAIFYRRRRTRIHQRSARNLMSEYWLLSSIPLAVSFVLAKFTFLRGKTGPSM